MIVGVGIDSVDINEMKRLIGTTDAATAFCLHTFSKKERLQADSRHDRASVYAGKFAVKEAVFKALARFTKEGFDFRFVECLEDENGAPYIYVNDKLQRVLDEAGAESLMCSITNESGIATAIVLAQGK